MQRVYIITRPLKLINAIRRVLGNGESEQASLTVAIKVMEDWLDRSDIEVMAAENVSEE